MVVAWKPCEDYSPDRIAELVPKTGLTPVEVAALDSVPVEDRIWALLRSEVLGGALEGAVEAIVQRAIRRVLGHSGCPEWEEWAEKWLSGEDRTSAAYSAAAYAAYSAAAYAADSAAARAAERQQQLADIVAALETKRLLCSSSESGSSQTLYQR